MNTTIDLSQIQNLPVTYGMNPNLPVECWDSTRYSLECVYNAICPQFNAYFINMGLTVVIAFVVISWLKWAFLKYWYKKLPNKKLKIIGNIHERETRIYWDLWIQARLMKVLIGYIVVVVYLSMI